MIINRYFQYQNNRCVGVIGELTGCLFLALALVGCAHTISKDILNEVDKEIGFEKLLEDPSKYQGKVVLLGGVIVKAINKKEGTLLEIYQTELDHYERPINTDVSHGRFLALYEEFLDSEIYSKGRRVTVAGVVSGVQFMKLGEIDYHYPYLVIKEIHLWEERQRREIGLYHRGYWDPWFWGPWYQWYDPYWFYPWYPQSKDENQDNSE